MSKHTPGPWTVIKEVLVYATEINHITKETEEIEIADCSGYWGNCSKEANAHLIAAAPELLSACEGLLNALPSATTHPAIKAARSAIAKAKGELGEIQIRRKTSYS